MCVCFVFVVSSARLTSHHSSVLGSVLVSVSKVLPFVRSVLLSVSSFGIEELRAFLAQCRSPVQVRDQGSGLLARQRRTQII